MPKQSNFTKPKILLQNGPGRLRSFASLPATTTTTEANIEIAEHRNVERMGRIGSRLVDRQLAKKCETQQQQQQNHRRLTSDILAFDPIHRIRLPEIKRLQQFQQDKPKPMQQMKPKVSEPKSQQQMEIRILDTRMIRKQKNLILSRKLELQKQQQMLENERKKQIQLKRTLEQKKSEKFLKSRTRTIFSNVVSKFPTTTSSLASPSLSVIEVTPDSITFPLSSSSSTNSKSLQLHDSQVLLIQFSKDDNEYHVYTKNGREFELSIDWNGDSEPTPLWIQFSVNSDLVQTFSKDGIMQQIPPPLISHPIRIHESSMRNSTEKFSEDFSSEELMICCDPSLQMEFKQETEDDDDDDDYEEEENQEEEQEEVEKEEQEVESWKPKRGRPRKSEIMIPIKQSSKILINERRQRTRTIK